MSELDDATREYLREIGRRGARAANATVDTRERARRAAQARWARVGVKDFRRPDKNAHPSDATTSMSSAERLRNVAQCVLRQTQIVRDRSGRTRHRTYVADVDAIAEAARQLAELVLEQPES